MKDAKDKGKIIPFPNAIETNTDNFPETIELPMKLIEILLAEIFVALEKIHNMQQK